ncbi:MAG: nuclear transport factor 2 family protein, partial [Bryobacterales bacterium]|nr:nuclear transport factor 2 family protein [Bryobacterales bacterium]
MNNSDIVSAFLRCYEKQDAEGMGGYLDAKVRFSDMAFELITGDNVRAMWAWFCEPSRTRDNQPVKVRNSEITRVDGDRVEARYEVDYTLTEEKKPRRTVRYVILSDFTLRDGKIISQRDTPSISQFAFARMALGFPGCLL